MNFLVSVMVGKMEGTGRSASPAIVTPPSRKRVLPQASLMRLIQQSGTVLLGKEAHKKQCPLTDEIHK